MKNLVINSDDFGMCHSVNIGTIKGFKEGILTQTTIMAPCPWFEEAAKLAVETDIPCGVHLTSACEWNFYRWKPLTNHKSIVQEDGSAFSTIEELKKKVDLKEIEDEYCKQVELVMKRGVKPSHIDAHMDLVDAGVFANVCRKYGLKSRRPLGDKYKDCMFHFDSYNGISAKPAKEKRAWLENLLNNMPEGNHFVMVHLSEPSSEMESITSDAILKPWAQEYRADDYEMLLDPKFKKLCEKNNINLISLRDLK